MKRWAWLLVGLNIALAAQVSDFRLQQTLPLYGLGQYIRALAFSPDDRQLLVVDEDPLGSTLMLWDIKKSVPLWRKKVAIPQGYTWRATFIDADRIRLELGTFEGLEFSAKTGALLSTIHNLYPALDVRPDWIKSLAVHGNLLAYSLKEGLLPPNDPSEVRLVSLETGQEVGRLKELYGGVGRLAFSPDGRILAVDRGSRISLWDVARRTKLSNLRGVHPDATETIWTGFNQHFVISQSGQGLHVWDAVSGQLLYRFLDLPPVRTAELNHAEDTLAQGLQLGTIHLLDLSSRTIKARLGFPTQQVVFSKDGRSLLVLSGDSRLRLYSQDAAGQYRLQQEDVLGLEIAQVAWLESRQELLLAVYPLGNFALYDLRTHNLTRFQIPLYGTFSSLVPLDNSQVLLGTYGVLDLDARTVNALGSNCNWWQLRLDLGLDSCLRYKNLRLQRLDGSLVWERSLSVEGGFLPVWSPSGRLLALPGLKEQIAFLNPQNGQARLLLKVIPLDHNNTLSNLRQLLFSPDETLVVAFYGDGRVRYFDLGARRELAMPVTLGKTEVLQFTPDGRLMTQDQEGLHFWRVPKAKVYLP